MCVRMHHSTMHQSGVSDGYSRHPPACQCAMTRSWDKIYEFNRDEETVRIEGAVFKNCKVNLYVRSSEDMLVGEAHTGEKRAMVGST